MSIDLLVLRASYHASTIVTGKSSAPWSNVYWVDWALFASCSKAQERRQHAERTTRDNSPLLSLVPHDAVGAEIKLVCPIISSSMQIDIKWRRFTWQDDLGDGGRVDMWLFLENCLPSITRFLGNKTNAPEAASLAMAGPISSGCTFDWRCTHKSIVLSLFPYHTLCQSMLLLML